MLKYLIEKEFKHILRDKFMPKVIIMFPCMVMFLLPWAASMDIKNINVGIVDMDHSDYSRQLTEKIGASNYFHLVNLPENIDNAMKDIESSKADMILEIPLDFEKSLITEGFSKVMISSNAVNSVKGGLGSSYMANIINDFATEIRTTAPSLLSQNNLQTAEIPIIEMLSQNRFNPYLRYKVFIIPALMSMLITLLCGFLPAFAIVSEKEIGTIEQINVTPVRKEIFILSKLIPYWIIGIFAFSLSLIIAWLLYNLLPAGNIFVLYLFLMLFILVVSGLGLVISNYSRTMQQAMFVMFFFIILFVLISGLFTPIASMPKWAQWITVVNPLTYFVEVMRMVYLKGSGFMSLLPQLFALIGFTIFFLGWAVLSYKKKS